LLLGACKKKDTPAVGNPGDLMSYEIIDSMDLTELDNIRTSDLIIFLSTASIKGDTAKDFHEFKIGYPEFMAAIPRQLDSTFTTEFFQDARSSNTPFWEILSSSEAYKWFSSTPLRAYYGLMDEAVPEYIAKLAVDYMNLLGKTDAQSFSAGTFADHRNTYIESIIDAKSWIDSF
jgi:hypothetical protein